MIDGDGESEGEGAESLDLESLMRLKGIFEVCIASIFDY